MDETTGLLRRSASFVNDNVRIGAEGVLSFSKCGVNLGSLGLEIDGLFSLFFVCSALPGSRTFLIVDKHLESQWITFHSQQTHEEVESRCLPLKRDQALFVFFAPALLLISSVVVWILSKLRPFVSKVSRVFAPTGLT
jgi:hypothetical protein